MSPSTQRPPPPCLTSVGWNSRQVVRRECSFSTAASTCQRRDAGICSGGGRPPCSRLRSAHSSVSALRPAAAVHPWPGAILRGGDPGFERGRSSGSGSAWAGAAARAARTAPERAGHRAVALLAAQVAGLVGAVDVLGAHKAGRVARLAADLQRRGRGWEERKQQPPQAPNPRLTWHTSAPPSLMLSFRCLMVAPGEGAAGGGAAAAGSAPCTASSATASLSSSSLSSSSSEEDELSSSSSSSSRSSAITHFAMSAECAPDSAQDGSLRRNPPGRHRDALNVWVGAPPAQRGLRPAAAAAAACKTALLSLVMALYNRRIRYMGVLKAGCDRRMAGTCWATGGGARLRRRGRAGGPSAQSAKTATGRAVAAHGRPQNGSNPCPHLLGHRVLGEAEAEEHGLGHVVGSDGALTACGDGATHAHRHAAASAPPLFLNPPCMSLLSAMPVWLTLPGAMSTTCTDVQGGVRGPSRSCIPTGPAATPP